MNKFLFFILLSTVLPINSIANINSAKIAEIQLMEKFQQDSIAVLKKEISQLKNKKEYQIEKLERNIQQASDTIARQNSLFDAFSYIYTVIGIIVTILIAVPIINFWTVIRPAIEDARIEINRARTETDRARTTNDNAETKIAEFNSEVDSFISQAKEKIDEIAGEGKLEKRIGIVLNNIEKKEIDIQINNLESGNPFVQNHAVDFIYTLDYEKFTIEQLTNIYCVLKTNKSFNTTQKVKVIQRFSYKQSKIADMYFTTDSLYDEDSMVIKETFWYFTKDKNFHLYSSAVVDFLKKSDSLESAFITLFLKLKTPGITYIPYIINEHQIVEMLSEEEALKVLSELADNKYEEIRKEITESYLFNKYKKI